MGGGGRRQLEVGRRERLGGGRRERDRGEKERSREFQVLVTLCVKLKELLRKGLDLALKSLDYLSCAVLLFQASAMAVDCLGKWTVLAGRKLLSLVDLEDSHLKLHRNPRQSKWDISCVQWNPHPSHANLFVTASNQKLDVFSWQDTGINHQSSIRGHSRTVSDVSWSPFDVNIIASCSVDALINLWDIRDTKKPSSSFQTVAGASQVKWNRMTNNLFATTHEGDVRIWDTRVGLVLAYKVPHSSRLEIHVKGNSPLHYIAAHISKIHGLDWSHTSESNLATSSQDGSIKFWDITNPRQCKGTLTAGLPVWRARYTPFGQGLVTVVVPQLRRGDNVLYLWDTNHNAPVHQFVGHNDVILEFQWRKLQENSKDFQLVTWSKDQTLRIWKIDPSLQKKCGHDVGDISDSSENEMTLPVFTSQSSEEAEKVQAELERQMSLSPDNYQGQQPRSLQQEFELINTEIPNIRVEELDLEKRMCKVVAMTKSGSASIGLVMKFPENYPFGSAPAFEFQEQNINIGVKQRLHRVLSDTALRHLKRKNNCLEPCLRQLSNALEFPMNPEERRTPESEMPYPFPSVTSKMSQSSYHMHSYMDLNIPFPRTSGAKFCAAGYLVVFGRAQEAQKGPSGTDFTPKSLSELVEYSSKMRMRTVPVIKQQNFLPFQFAQSPPKTVESVTIKEWYYRGQFKGKRGRSKEQNDSRSKEQEKKPHLSSVKIFDIFTVLPINRQLGQKYIINVDDIPAMCSHNAKVAESMGRKDLVRVYDVQTLAMLCCVFWDRRDAVPVKPRTQSTPIDHTPQNESSLLTEAMAGPVADKAVATLTPGLISHVTSPPILPSPMTFLHSQLTEVSSHPNLAALAGVLKMRRSNSWSCLEDSFEDYRFEDDGVNVKEKEAEREQRQHDNNCRMLDPSGQHQYDQFLHSYSDILFHWGLKNQSAQVLKFANSGRESHKGIEFGVKCHYCGQNVRGAYCGCCKNLAFNCVICHTGVKGLVNFCLSCGHGGHTSHLMEWFKTESVCPTGCGCTCALADYSLIYDTS
ncbi:hypothetical protein FSP39_013508 [Pinctada imbricata]|uniref:RWD domain-containing protein n=1 Tax=Pinctada imbricata TaxID=66713 RepID=A0AA89BP60_PINIB|nr:hypothetical protein FSP39_013508 [Pinctada imbricata]